MKKIFWITALVVLSVAFAGAAVIKPDEVKIPAEYGRITERFNGNSDKLVVHLQDAHTNYEAQKNSAHILEELINRYGLYLILVEGGSRDVSLNYYREQYTPQQRKELAEESLKNGVIAGEEYLNIVSDYPMKLQGIEDRTLYDRNMEAYLEIHTAKNGALLFTKAMSGLVGNLKMKIYNKPLKQLDEKRIGFKEEKVNLNEYVIYLDKLMNEKMATKKGWFRRIVEKLRLFLARHGILKNLKTENIDLSAYPNYKNLVTSIQLEKTIDFAEVEKERAEVIELLSKKLDENTLNELLSNSVDFKAGKLTQVQYHNYLKEIMGREKLKLNKYSNLERYIRYLTIYDKIDSAKLFRELKSVESVLGQSLAATEEQRQLLKIAKNLELLIELINLKLAPDDFDYYLKNEGDFNVGMWARFLNSQAIRYKLAQRAPENTEVIDKITLHLKNFYSIARKRDEVFLNNTKKYMDENGVNLAVLIAGGFHTPTLMELFRNENISYLVVAPKVLKPSDEKLYHKILTEGWAPSEK